MAITSKSMHASVTAEPGAGEHFVQFYEADDYLLNSLYDFASTALNAGDACIVIATEAHRTELAARLQAGGVDLAAANASRKFFALDAGETLAKFMVNGSPEPQRFTRVIKPIIGGIVQGPRPAHVFGEMVALLWLEGNHGAAIRLEELWNDFMREIRSFALFCAYPARAFAGEVYGEPFGEICQCHARVIPDESYTYLSSPDERLRAITLLQQKANSLQAEIAEQRRLEARYRQLFDSNLIGVFVSDFSGTFLDANDAFLNLLGYTRAELLAGAIRRDTLTPPEFRSLSQDALHALQTTGRSNPYEKEYLHKNGRRIPVLVAVTRIEQSDTCIGFVLDISERKERDKRKDEFISMASYELKTPVTSLKGFLGILQRHPTIREDEKAQYYITRMDSQIDKLTHLINDLLDISKMNVGRITYREDHFSLDELLAEIVENVQETTQTHRLVLEGQTQARIFGDRDRIGQVLTNLLNNAIKYSPLADRVLIHANREPDRILVCVRDFGIGIDPAHQQRIFERFYQVTDSDAKTYPGLGIGLYICSVIVKRHGGKLWVESTKGEGSTFYFTLPLLQERSNKSFP